MTKWPTIRRALQIMLAQAERDLIRDPSVANTVYRDGIATRLRNDTIDRTCIAMKQA